MNPLPIILPLWGTVGIGKTVRDFRRGYLGLMWNALKRDDIDFERSETGLEVTLAIQFVLAILANGAAIYLIWRGGL